MFTWRSRGARRWVPPGPAQPGPPDLPLPPLCVGLPELKKKKMKEREEERKM